MTALALVADVFVLALGAGFAFAMDVVAETVAVRDTGGVTFGTVGAVGMSVGAKILKCG